jgi:hypothetical protein
MHGAEFPARRVMYSPRPFSQMLRIFSGMGEGASIQRILSVRTYGHHWKIYTCRELIKYFALLSNDFLIGNLKFFMPLSRPAC